MRERKNIFLIGRRRMEGDEDQLTEMLAFLWQEAPETLDRWLESIGVETDGHPVEVETQATIPSGKRPDILVSSRQTCMIVESKLKSGFGGSQISSYLDYLAESQAGERALVLLTKRPEVVPEGDASRARDAGIRLISCRWHDMADQLAEPGEESLAGDFVQLLIREGLVKPKPLETDDWKAWNEGFNVLLRLGAFLDELDPIVRRLLPGAKWDRPANGLSKRWIYRVWRTGEVELGFGLGAAAGDRQPHSDPIAFAFVGNKSASDEERWRAVGVDKATRDRWARNDQVDAITGLLYGWPCLIRAAENVLNKGTFEDQLEQAAAFVYEAAAYFRARGFLPSSLHVVPVSVSGGSS